MRGSPLKVLKRMSQPSIGHVVHGMPQSIASLFNCLSTLTSMPNSASPTISLFV